MGGRTMPTECPHGADPRKCGKGECLWINLYLDAVKRFSGMGTAVWAKAAEGGTPLDLIDVVADWFDGCDHVDDESLAAYERAKATATDPKRRVAQLVADGVLVERECGLCGGRGRSTRIVGEIGYPEAVERDCSRCKGSGRDGTYRLVLPEDAS